MRYTIHLYALPFQLPSWYPTLQFAATFLAHSNSAINPVIYAGLNENFKRGGWTITYMVWNMLPLIARFMGSTWSPSGADRTQVGPMLAHEFCYLGHVLKLRWMILYIFHYFLCIQSKFVSCSPIEMEMSFWRNLETVCQESCQIPVQPVSKFNQYHISIVVSVLCLPSSVPCNTGPRHNDSIVIIRIIAAYCSNYDEIGWLRLTAVTIIGSLDRSIKPKCINTMTYEQIGMNWFLKKYSKYEVCWKQISYFDSNFTEVYCYGPIDNETVLVNIGLAQNLLQDQRVKVLWRHMTSL